MTKAEGFEFPFVSREGGREKNQEEESLVAKLLRILKYRSVQERLTEI